MKIRLTRITIALATLAAIAVALAGYAAEPAKESKSAAGAAKPAHRVVACYFHRTVRCPTCKKISAYIEESLKTGLAAELKDGTVQWVMIDFQDPANEKYTAAYQISNPTLVIMDVNQDKVAAWKPAPKVWSLVGDKDAFYKYVQNEVRAYLNPKQGAAPQTSAR